MVQLMPCASSCNSVLGLVADDLTRGRPSIPNIPPRLPGVLVYPIHVWPFLGEERLDSIVVEAPPLYVPICRVLR